MTKQEIANKVGRELKKVVRAWGKETIEAWDRGVQDTHDMDGDEAFARGYYRGLQDARDVLIGL